MSPSPGTLEARAGSVTRLPSSVKLMAMLGVGEVMIAVEAPTCSEIGELKLGLLYLRGY